MKVMRIIIASFFFLFFTHFLYAGYFLDKKHYIPLRIGVAGTSILANNTSIDYSFPVRFYLFMGYEYNFYQIKSKLFPGFLAIETGLRYIGKGINFFIPALDTEYIATLHIGSIQATLKYNMTFIKQILPYIYAGAVTDFVLGIDFNEVGRMDTLSEAEFQKYNLGFIAGIGVFAYNIVLDISFEMGLLSIFSTENFTFLPLDSILSNTYYRPMTIVVSVGTRIGVL